MHLVPVYADIFSITSKLLSTISAALLTVCMNMVYNAPDANVMNMWFIGKYSTMYKMAMLMMVPIVLAATVGIILRGSLLGLFRTFVIGTAVAVFGSAVALSVVTICIEIDNDLVQAVTHGELGTIENVNRLNDALSQAHTETDIPIGVDANVDTSLRKVVMPALQAVFMLIMIPCCLFMWFELVFRQVMIYMAVLFLPMSFAAYLWGPIRIWLYMLAEICVTMIFAKFIIAAIAGFGFQAVTVAFVGDAKNGANVTGSEQWGLFMGGTLVLFAACVAVPALIAFVMQPTHAILQRKQVGGFMPTSNKNTYARGLLQSGLRVLKGGR